MTASDVIRQLFESNANSLKFVEAMRDQPLARPGGQGNSAHWTIGHLYVAEGRLWRMLTGEPNPAESLKPLFDWGSEPRDDGAGYPPLDDLLARYRGLRAKTAAWLEARGDAGLDAPLAWTVPGLESVFVKVGPTVVILAMHQAFHLGEVAAARRAVGGRPFFEPTAAMLAN